MMLANASFPACARRTGSLNRTGGWLAGTLRAATRTGAGLVAGTAATGVEMEIVGAVLAAGAVGLAMTTGVVGAESTGLAACATAGAAGAVLATGCTAGLGGGAILAADPKLKCRQHSNATESSSSAINPITTFRLLAGSVRPNGTAFMDKLAFIGCRNIAN